MTFISYAHQQMPSEAGEVTFQNYVPSQASSHPSYFPLSVIALLIPPLGLLAFLFLHFSRNELDRILGKTLFWRSITLPTTAIACYYFVVFMLNITPAYGVWRW